MPYPLGHADDCHFLMTFKYINIKTLIKSFSPVSLLTNCSIFDFLGCNFLSTISFACSMQPLKLELFSESEKSSTANPTDNRKVIAS